MRKVIVILLFAVFAVVGLAAIAIGQEKAAAAPKEYRWHGVIVNINTEKSTIDVRRDTAIKTIHYDSSTKWTKGTKVADMSEFKVGMVVICLGTYEKGNVVMNATRIDLRTK
jgi:hypothetical protein